MKPNRLLHFPSATGKIPRRGPFLDGTDKTYFGVGQTIQSLEEEWDNGGDYTPPAEWLKSGRLLKAPQIVWISVIVPNGHDSTVHTTLTHYGSAKLYTDAKNTRATVADDGVSSPYGYCGDIIADSGFTPVATYQNGASEIPETTEDVTLDNPAHASYLRILDAANDAAATLTGIRADRTVVLVRDFQDFTDESLGTGLRPQQLFAPPAELEFFGTNFLHIVVSPTSITLDLDSPIPGSWFDDSSTDQWPISLADAMKAPEKFNGYHVMLFGAEDILLSFPQQEDMPAMPAIPHDIATFDDGLTPEAAENAAETVAWNDGVVSHEVSPLVFRDEYTYQPHYKTRVFGSGITPGSPAVPVTPASPVQPTAVYAAEFIDHINRSSQALVDALESHSYHGDSTSITSASLVDLIASHFQFDPSTGRDLSRL